VSIAMLDGVIFFLLVKLSVIHFLRTRIVLVVIESG